MLKFSAWTSQGLNLGPPDYESVALTNWATSPIFLLRRNVAAKLACFRQISKLFNRKSQKNIVFHAFLRIQSILRTIDRDTRNRFFAHTMWWILKTSSSLWPCTRQRLVFNKLCCFASVVIIRLSCYIKSWRDILRRSDIRTKATDGQFLRRELLNEQSTWRK